MTQSTPDRMGEIFRIIVSREEFARLVLGSQTALMLSMHLCELGIAVGATLMIAEDFPPDDYGVPLIRYVSDIHFGKSSLVAEGCAMLSLQAVSEREYFIALDDIRKREARRVAGRRACGASGTSASERGS